MERPEKTELVDLLRMCGSGSAEVCEGCPYRDRDDCSGNLMLDGADALAAELGLKRM